MKCYLKINVRIFLNKVRVKSSLLYCLCITKYILWCMVYLFDVDRVQMDKRFVLVERSFIKHCGICFFFKSIFQTQSESFIPEARHLHQDLVSSRTIGVADLCGRFGRAFEQERWRRSTVQKEREGPQLCTWYSISTRTHVITLYNCITVNINDKGDKFFIVKYSQVTHPAHGPPRLGHFIQTVFVLFHQVTSLMHIIISWLVLYFK